MAFMQCRCFLLYHWFLTVARQWTREPGNTETGWTVSTCRGLSSAWLREITHYHLRRKQKIRQPIRLTDLENKSMLQYCFPNKKAEKLSSHIGIQSPKSATILCFNSSVPYFDENVNGSSEISSQIDGLRMQETSLTDQIGAVLNNKSQDLFSVPELQLSQGLNNLDSDIIIRTSRKLSIAICKLGNLNTRTSLRKCLAALMCNPLQQRNGNVRKHNTFRTESSLQTEKEFEQTFFFSVWYRLACG